MSPATSTATVTKDLGYRTHSIGGFRFERDEYFAHIHYPGGRHIMPIELFLRNVVRDVAWGFFYGTINFDDVIGTVNHYGTVEMFVGLFNEAYRSSNRHYVETFDSDELKAAFQAMLEDWVNEGFDPFAAPEETGSPYGPKRGSNLPALHRKRLVASRMVGLAGDLAYRTDADGFPLNRQFQDISTDKPEVHAEPGFEGQVHAYNMFDYVARSDVTWNPSVVSCVGASLFCATTEEHILPCTHGNDRVEWFFQATDTIIWDVADRATGKPRAKVVMNAGDVAAMPADIRHRGYSPKRALLVVWENGDPTLPELYGSGKMSPYPIEF